MTSNGKGATGRVIQEAADLRREIREGRFQRSMAAITGLSAIVSGAEAYAQHRRGAFTHWLMWTPVWLTPPSVAAAAAAVASERAARRLLPAVSAAVIADGVLGFAYHIRGIRRMPGGFRLGQYNLVMGPPVFAPLLLCTVGVAGVLTGKLRRGRPAARVRPSSRAGRVALALRRLLASARAASRREAERSKPWRRDAWRRDADRAADGGVDDGSLKRGLAITTAALGAVAGGEAYFEHLRGSFNDRWMWTPIWLTPPMVAAAAGAAVNERIARRVLPITSAVTLMDGALGFTLHLRGLQRMPGDSGNTAFKLAMGPPLFAPLLFSAVGLFGLVASLLRGPRETRGSTER